MKHLLVVLVLAVFMVTPTLAAITYTGGDNPANGNESQSLYDGVYYDWTRIVFPYVSFDLGQATTVQSISVRQLSLVLAYPDRFGLIDALNVQTGDLDADNIVRYTEPLYYRMDNRNNVYGTFSWVTARIIPTTVRFVQIYTESTGAAIKTDEIAINGIDGGGNPINPITHDLDTTVTLQDYVADKTAVRVSISLVEQYGDTTTAILKSDSNGKILLDNIPAGNYTLLFWARHWLRRAVPNVNLNTDISGITASLVNGDVDNSNTVDSNDAALVSKAIGSKPGSKKWNIYADLDGNGRIDRADLAIVTKNLGAIGDP